MTGDIVVQLALRTARHTANSHRGSQHGAPDFGFGMAVGQMCVGRSFLTADPLIVAAADNEIEFLRFNYVRRCAS